MEVPGRVKVAMISVELLVKYQEMGKKIYLLVLSGTEVVEERPVRIVNSQQTLILQFSNRELYGKNLTNLIGFPQGTTPQQGLL